MNFFLFWATWPSKILTLDPCPLPSCYSCRSTRGWITSNIRNFCEFIPWVYWYFKIRTTMCFGTRFVKGFYRLYPEGESSQPVILRTVKFTTIMGWWTNLTLKVWTRKLNSTTPSCVTRARGKNTNYGPRWTSAVAFLTGKHHYGTLIFKYSTTKKGEVVFNWTEVVFRKQTVFAQLTWL